MSDIEKLKEIVNNTILYNNNSITFTIPIIYKRILDSFIVNYESNYNENFIIITLKENNMLDFLCQLYKNDNNNILTTILNNNLHISKMPVCKYVKTDENAVIPSKLRASDVGMDLTIIKKFADISKKTTLYDTGIIVTPEFGYYTKIVARSSLIKSGYILTNSIGIIDPTFSSSLKISLTKIDDSLPDLKLPFRCAQLILDRAIPFEMKEITEKDIPETKRGQGGFGSTN